MEDDRRGSLSGLGTMADAHEIDNATLQMMMKRLSQEEQDAQSERSTQMLDYDDGEKVWVLEGTGKTPYLASIVLRPPSDMEPPAPGHILIQWADRRDISHGSAPLSPPCGRCPAGTRRKATGA